MRKTLERLQKNTIISIKGFMDRDNERMSKLNQAGHTATIDALSTFQICIQYIGALEDYSGELDEEWDKLLKSVEQAAQKKPSERKTQYRV